MYNVYSISFLFVSLIYHILAAAACSLSLWKYGNWTDEKYLRTPKTRTLSSRTLTADSPDYQVEVSQLAED